MTSTLPEARFAATALDVLEDYLALCKDACDGEITRLYSPGQRGSSGLYELILDYPLRGGKALRPALSIATCLGLGGHLEAILPTAATLELYHNAFLIHDDIEDESWWRRGQTHDAHRPRRSDRRQRGRRHAVTLAATPSRQRRARRARAGTAHPAGRRPHDSADRRGPGDRARVGPVQHLAARRRRLPRDGGAEDELVLVHHTAAGRRDRRRRRTRSGWRRWSPSAGTSARPFRSPTTC